MMRILIIYQIIKAKKLCRTYFLGFGTAFYHIEKNSFILKSIKKVDQPFYSAKRVGFCMRRVLRLLAQNKARRSRAFFN